VRQRTASRGFTLLEVVLAVSLTLVLMVAMLTFYRQAADVRAAVVEEAELIGAERAVMDLMTEQLRGAFVFQFLGQGMDGGLTQARFSTVTLPSRSVWLVQGITETEEIPPERDLEIVAYRVRYVEDEYGDMVAVGLERTCQKVLTPRVAEEAEEGEEGEIQATLLTPHLKFIRFQYWDGSAWLESWSGGDLPQAVEIVLGAQPLPEDFEDPFEYPYPTFRRVVFVPAAAQGRSGPMIRGLGGMGGL